MDHKLESVIFLVINNFFVLGSLLNDGFCLLLSIWDGQAYEVTFWLHNFLNFNDVQFFFAALYSEHPGDGFVGETHNIDIL